MLCVAVATEAKHFIFIQPSSSSAGSGSGSASLGKQHNNRLIRLQWHRHRPNHASATSIGAFQCSSSPSSSFPSTPSSPMRPLPVLEEELCLGLSDIKANCKTWSWRGHKINYLVYGAAAAGGGDDDITTSKSRRLLPLLLVHGFGASIAHWRRYLNYPIIISIFIEAEA